MCGLGLGKPIILVRVFFKPINYFENDILRGINFSYSPIGIVTIVNLLVRWNGKNLVHDDTGEILFQGDFQPIEKVQVIINLSMPIVMNYPNKIIVIVIKICQRNWSRVGILVMVLRLDMVVIKVVLS